LRDRVIRYYADIGKGCFEAVIYFRHLCKPSVYKLSDFLIAWAGCASGMQGLDFGYNYTVAVYSFGHENFFLLCLEQVCSSKQRQVIFYLQMLCML